MVEDTKRAYREWMARHEWSWFVTFHLENNHYDTYLRRIREQFRRENRGQLGMSGIFAEGGGHGPHVHSLWLAALPRSRTLHDIHPELWVNKIGDIVKNRSAVDIQPLYTDEDRQNVIDYLFCSRNVLEGPGAVYELFDWGRLVTRGPRLKAA